FRSRHAARNGTRDRQGRRQADREPKRARVGQGRGVRQRVAHRSHCDRCAGIRPRNGLARSVRYSRSSALGHRRCAQRHRLRCRAGSAVRHGKVLAPAVRDPDYASMSKSSGVLGRPMTVRAHAKINLDLRVLGTRPDGFHELRTVFQALALHDTVECIPREGPFAIECDAAGVPLDRANLVWRAADALWRSLRRDGPVRDVLVRIQKRIPLQGGLGGGSTDAAATLLGLTHAWRVPVRGNQLVDVASTLGADVAFFLSGGTALGLGRGDEIYSLADLPRHWVVLLIPGFGVATVDAYGWYDAERDPARGPMVPEAP